MLAQKHVVLIVTGGIAAYKAPILVRQLIKAKAQVRVIMTPNAQAFVTKKTLATVSQAPVYDEQYLVANGEDITHLSLVKWADCFIVAPATANTIAKIAQGVADNLATTTILARQAEQAVYLFPAMNDQMYRQAATQRNLTQLRTDGFLVFAPETGPLAEGYQAIGRMPEPETIVHLVGQYEYRKTHTQLLQQKKVLVTAGGMREAIDPVRYIGNHSSGKMGYALARAAYLAGAEVTLITSVTKPCLFASQQIQVTSTAELQVAVAKHFPKVDVLIMAAAPADFKVDNPQQQKIKKQSSQTTLTLKLSQNPDILASLTPRADQFVVGFAAETQNLLANAQHKLAAKHLNMIVANQVGRADRGFNSDQNQGTILTADGQQIALPLMSKQDMALKIVQLIGERL